MSPSRFFPFGSVLCSGAIALLFGVVTLHATMVTTTGMAPGDTPAARSQALADALRQAVERGAGVELLSTSETRNMALVSDEVVTQAFGYIQDYQILESGLRTDGVYAVKVQANVSPGAPDRGAKLALRTLVNRKGSPRVALLVRETLEGVPPGQQPVRDWLEQAARELQLNLVSVEQLREQEAEIAARDQRVNPNGISPVLQRLANEADYVIETDLAVRHLGQSNFGGSLPHHRFAVSGVIRVLQPDTGAILATVPITGADNLRVYTADLAAATREAATQALGGKGDATAQGAWVAFQRMLAQWATELDLGMLVRLELPVMDGQDQDRVLAALHGNDQFGGVWVRGVDSATGAQIDVESRLPSYDLARFGAATKGTDLAVDLVTAHFVRLKTAKASILPRVKPVWIAVAVLGVGVVLVGLNLLRSKR